jgi:hypothetical protein
MPMRSIRVVTVMACVAALGTATRLAGQGPDTAIVIHPESTGLHFVPPQLPRAIVDEAVQLYNLPTTTRLAGRVVLPVGNTWHGDVVVRNGPALIGGRVEGSLVLLNGDLTLQASARITGNLLVIGGAAVGPRDVVDGTVRVFADPLPYKVERDTLVYTPDLWRRLRLSARYTFGRGESRSTLLVATAGTYNRIEGLPIVAGPSVDLILKPDLALHAGAVGIFRTARSLTGECCDLGYTARGEIRAGSRQQAGLSVRAFDLVTPVEDWGLHNNEIGWEAWLVRRDYRDYYRDRGAAVRLAWQAEAPLTLGLELRREYQGTLHARDPWSLARTGEVWRPNPPIDNGYYTTWSPSVVLDTRNDRVNPTSGWYLHASLDISHSDDATSAPGVPVFVRDSTVLTGSYAFSRVFFDFRRYTRISGPNRLNVRFVVGGWVGGDPLPLQKRLSFGGPEPMPGYEFRQSACNQQFTAPDYAGTKLAACDRVLALQVEYRGHVSLRAGYNPETGETSGLGLVTRFLRGPDFVVLGDAGQAWLVGKGPGRLSSGQLPSLSSWLADLGLGVDWGGFGIYATKAVNATQPLRLTARIEHRF